MSNNGAPESVPHFRFGFNDGTLALLGAAILLVGAVVWSSQQPNVEKADFALTYMGAVLAHRGLGAQLYNTELQEQTLHSLFRKPNPLFFEHPPFEALLFSPLAPVPFRLAFLIWGLINAAVWLLLMVLLRRHLPWPNDALGYVCLWLLFAPLAVALYQGQTSIILLALFAIAFVQLKMYRELSAGLALGFGLFKFQFVLPFALIFLLRKRWRFVGGFMISLCVLTALSFIEAGVHGNVQYLRLLLAVVKNPHNVSFGSAVDMPTIHGFLYAIVGTKVAPIGLTVVSSLLSVVLLVGVSQLFRSTAEGIQRELWFGAAIAASLAASSHMFTHDFSPLILALFLTGAHFRQAIGQNRVAIAAVLAVFWMFPIYFVMVKWHCLYLMCPVLLLFVYFSIRVADDASRVTTAAVEYAKA